MSPKGYCPYCGGKIDVVGAEFCIHCGAALSESIPGEAKAVQTVVITEQPPTLGIAVCEKYGHAYGGGMTGLKWFVIFITLCSVIIPIILYIVWNKKKCIRCGMKEP